MGEIIQTNFSVYLLNLRHLFFIFNIQNTIFLKRYYFDEEE